MATEALPFGIAILGPTGSGKSRLAMQVAAARPVEIISVDSAQVYRGLDIGTAKPGVDEQQAVVHHLIDIREPDQAYSAGAFRDDALRLIREITARGHVPMLVGGTMLYYRALFRGIAQLPVADAELRARIDARAARDGWPALHADLLRDDPDSAQHIHPNDAQRIQRALEVLALSGRSRESIWSGEPQPPRFDHWSICLLEPEDRARLHAVLAERLAGMLREGFLEEVQKLCALGLDENAPAMRLVGYRQLLSHCCGQQSLQDAAECALAATRQLAKRQMTWMRSDKLLPFGANVLRANPFDTESLASVRMRLIEARTAPC